MMIPVEHHPLLPFLPAKARLLMLGSFPPQQKRWSMNFFYPNLNNDMWRIFGLIFFDDKHHFLDADRKHFDQERIEAFLKHKGVALYDTATAVRRLKDNASDKFLEVVEPTDIPALLAEIPECEAIVTTGQKATDTLRTLFDVDEPAMGNYVVCPWNGRSLKLFRMPSSSRAYPLSIEKKAEAYHFMFNTLGLLTE